MAITYRTAQKIDFETLLKPSIRASSYYDVGSPPVHTYEPALRIEFEEETSTLEICPSSIPSGEAFGAPSINLNINASGIQSGEGFGVPALSLYLEPSGIPSQEAFGEPDILSIILCQGIPSEERFGISALIYDQYLYAQGICSGECFGIPSIKIRPLLKAFYREMVSRQSGFRFGIKKLPEIGRFDFKIKSIFGLKPLTTTCSISGTVYHSMASSAGYPDVTVILSGDVKATAITDDNGRYVFSGLANGSYSVTVNRYFVPLNYDLTIKGRNITDIDFYPGLQ
jgi:hypothetical protein